jgi:dsDNA-specific endonuclease/ATPase MutS2
MLDLKTMLRDATSQAILTHLLRIFNAFSTSTSTSISCHCLRILKDIASFGFFMSCDTCNALSPQSLILVDEVGRGTETAAGAALAGAILEVVLLPC